MALVIAKIIGKVGAPEPPLKHIHSSAQGPFKGSLRGQFRDPTLPIILAMTRVAQHALGVTTSKASAL